jgi:hypothetical protein
MMAYRSAVSEISEIIMAGPQLMIAITECLRKRLTCYARKTLKTLSIQYIGRMDDDGYFYIDRKGWHS